MGAFFLHSAARIATEWRLKAQRDLDHQASFESDNSTASNATARADRYSPIHDESDRTTPLLMRVGRSPSPNKPRTVTRSKADEQEEVNGLDLESLQLQDKEIAPEKLTKLEKIGSGGFKVGISTVCRRVGG